MSTKEELFKSVCGGDKEALLFLALTDGWLTKLRQFIAEGKKDPHQLIALMAETNRVFSLPYYRANAETLYVAVMKVLAGAEITELADAVGILKLGFAGNRKRHLAKEQEKE